MTKKIMLSLLGAGLVLGLTVPAFAQSDRGRGADQNSKSSYSQSSDRSRQADQRSRQRQTTDYRRDTRRGDDRHRDQRRGVKKLTFQTRYRAKIVLTENVVRGRRGPKSVCTVSVRGPQSRLVPKRRLHRIARSNCSRRAQIRYSV